MNKRFKPGVPNVAGLGRALRHQQLNWLDYFVAAVEECAQFGGGLEERNGIERLRR